jgi:hypothetical protein
MTVAPSAVLPIVVNDAVHTGVAVVASCTEETCNDMNTTGDEGAPLEIGTDAETSARTTTPSSVSPIVAGVRFDSI